MNAPHPLEVALAAQRLRGSHPPWRGSRRGRTGRRSLAWSRPGRKSAAWPRIRAWRIIRSSTAVRWAWPRCSEPVTFGGGWMIVNGGSVGIGGRAGAVGREDVRRQPALVDRAFDVARRVGLRQLRVIVALEHRTARSSSGRTGRGTTCWFGARGSVAHRDRAGSGTLSTRYRASTVTARERRSRRRSRAARTVPRSLRGRPGATLLGPRREARECSTGLVATQAAISARRPTPELGEDVLEMCGRRSFARRRARRRSRRSSGRRRPAGRPRTLGPSVAPRHRGRRRRDRPARRISSAASMIGAEPRASPASRAPRAARAASVRWFARRWQRARSTRAQVPSQSRPEARPAGDRGLERGPRLAGRALGERASSPRACSRRGLRAGDGPGQERLPRRQRASARRPAGRRPQGRLASRSRRTGRGRRRRRRPPRRPGRPRRGGSTSATSPVSRATSASPQTAGDSRCSSCICAPSSRASPSASRARGQSPRPSATNPRTWRAVIRVVIPPRPSARLAAASVVGLVPAPGRPQDVTEMGGHVVAVVPELDALGVVDALAQPSLAHGRTRRGRMRDDAEHPVGPSRLGLEMARPRACRSLPRAAPSLRPSGRRRRSRTRASTAALRSVGPSPAARARRCASVPYDDRLVESAVEHVGRGEAGQQLAANAVGRRIDGRLVRGRVARRARRAPRGAGPRARPGRRPAGVERRRAARRRPPPRA